MAPTTTTTGVTANSNGTSSTDIWSKLPLLPEDAIFELNNRANAATGVVLNLAIGAYRDEDGLPHPLQAIRKAERILLEKHMNYEYLPIAGFSPFVDAAVNLLYGDSIPSSRVLGVQSVSGTGAVMLGARLLTQIYDPKSTPVYLSNPTWPNHYNVLQAAGWTNVRTYRYYKPDTRGLDFEGYKADVLAAPDRSIFLIHACAHNPTGVDPTHAQWEELADLFQRKQHQVFFDCAYQGYASGSLERDAFAIRLFARKGIQFICAQSFSKNMGLYSERTGTLSVVLRDPSTSRAVKSQIEIFIREVYSSPPAHGARLAHLVLTDPSLRKEWEAELEGMAQRIHAMRKIVFDELTRLGTPGRWDHITNQIGMFSFLGLTKEQCVFCQNHNVFITLTGRANMAGLTEETAVVLAHVIDASLKA